MTVDSGHFQGSMVLHSALETSVKERVDIFFTGYLTNLTELARQTGSEYATGSSIVDVIGKCYRRWGRALPVHLDGQFALVIVNRQTAEVLLTHDALGVVPLYWSLDADTLRFSTCVRDLVDSRALNNLNLAEVERYLLFGQVVSEETVYSTIRRLEPGRSIWIRNGSVSSDVTWDPRSIEPIMYERSDEYIDHFLDLVNASVKGALLDHESAWIALSGGLDSNTILPPALKHCTTLKAFSIVSPQWPQLDESQWIERIVAARGLSWHPVNVEDVLPFGDLPKSFCGSPDAVVLNPGLVATLSELVAGDVLLTGDGGDSFMGSQMGHVPSHLADPMFKGELSAIKQDLLQWMRESKAERPHAYWIFHGLVWPSLRHVLRRSVRPPHYHLHPAWLRCGGRTRSNSRALRSKAPAPHCQTPGQQAILDDLWTVAEHPVLDDVRSSRHPLFYRPLFEFLWAIPWSQKQLPRCDRYLQRRALKGLVDDDVRTRVSYGTGSRSFVEGLSRSKEWQEFLCEGPAMAEFGLVDAEGWRHAIQQACVGQTNAEPLLFRAIAVETWLKQLSDYRP